MQWTIFPVWKKIYCIVCSACVSKMWGVKWTARTTGNPLSKRPNPSNATTGVIPNGLKNLKGKSSNTAWDHDPSVWERRHCRNWIWHAHARNQQHPSMCCSNVVLGGVEGQTWRKCPTAGCSRGWSECWRTRWVPPVSPSWSEGTSAQREREREMNSRWLWSDTPNLKQ